MLLSIPVISDKLPPIIAKSTAKIGPTERKKPFSVPAGTGKDPQDGTYTSKISVRI